MKKDTNNTVLKRFNTISIFGGDVKEVEYTIPDYDYGEYIVDKSHFVPNAEAVKNLTGNGAVATTDSGMYDFPDGRDTGAKVPYTRQHGYTGDIAELSTAVNEQSATHAENLDTAHKMYEQEQRQSKYKRNSKPVDSGAVADSGSSVQGV